VALLGVSIGLKAALRPRFDVPSRPPPALIGDQLARTLRSQGFSIRNIGELKASAILATRGECRLIARDAAGSESQMTLYARDAAAIGPLHYLFAGRRYDSPPTFAMFLSKTETKLLHGFRLGGRVHVAVALATSPECGDGDFGLGDIRVPV